MRKRRAGRAVLPTTGVLIALVSALVTPLSGAPKAAAAEPGDSAGQSEAKRALAVAKESGERVEVAGQRSERTTVFANPDGYTFTLEESAVPVRVARPDGGWTAPDATLRRNADGTVGPKAGAAEMTFSGGGADKPLARIAESGRSLELTWPGRLPEPELDGANALYREVLPGVDLKVTATPESFQHVLVVNSPAAAKNPALKKLAFGLKADGLDVREGAAGNLTAVDDDGRTVFKAPPARMWDSGGRTGTKAGGAGAKAGAAGAKTRSALAAPAGPATTAPTTPADPAETAPSGTGLEPGQGDAVARMDVRVGKDTLAVVPDPAMLSGTDSAAYPLFIDPTVTWGESERTLLRSDGYESYGWSNGDDDLGKGAGKCGVWNNYYCGPGYVQKLYFEFSPASLKGKQVLDATFRVTEPWAFQCSPRWVDLVRTDNISSSTTWTSRPTERDLMGDRNVSAGRGSLCDPDSPDAPIEFNDNPEETNENLTPTVRDFAAGKFSRLTLEIKAHDESDTAAWKRFKNDAVLAVDFVGVPDKPTSVGLTVGAASVCEKDAADPLVLSDPTPPLQATAQTKAGGEDDAHLRVAFDVDQRNDADNTWADSPVTVADTWPTTGFVGDGRKVTMNWSALSEGKLYRLRAWVRSYYNKDADYLSGPSNGTTTGWCYFKVDPTAPKAPQIKLGAPYTPCTTNDCAAHGGPGVPGSFTFSPDAADKNVASYEYKWSTDTKWTVPKAGSPLTVPLTPARSGTYTLQARARDNVGTGRPGAQASVDFLVAQGQGPVGRWHFDEASGVAVDSATVSGTTRHDATLNGGAVRDDRGRRGLVTHDAQGVPLAEPVTDKGLLLDGVDDYAQTAGGPALETRSAYTVSAWVRLDRKDKNASVLGQRGADGNPFVLWYSTSNNKWYFGVLKPDGTTLSGVYSSYTAEVGVWTHLAGSYDPATGELVFYVDGRVQGAPLITGAASWASNGPLQIGRYELPSGNATYYFPGSIDEVAVWQRKLSQREVADETLQLISQGYAGVELVADWDPAGKTGTTLADTASGYGRTLTLSGGATLDGEAIALDGVDDAATAPGPLVYDHAPFTVSTLVELDTQKLLSKDVGYIGQVMGQRTADGSSWGFWFELTGKDSVLDEETMEEVVKPVGKWHFGRRNANGTWSSVVSDQVAALDSEVRLTGVYDSLYGTISLYLGHNQNGDDLAYSVQLGAGDFAVGKGYAAGAWQHYLPARVHDVRLWAGAMASGDQIDARVGD
ncbi:LamG domain-containing protein [Streptomyces sp. NPDC057690]|uniref:LamG domain-containing protein n=1 Tax=Streptomyces sp. NPDC057690 TaxID=3346214 RepID=UPI003673B346